MDASVDGNDLERTARPVRAPFCCSKSINADGHLSGDRAVDMVKKSHQRKIFVSFIQMFLPGNRSQLKLFGSVAIKTQRNITSGDYFYVSYCCKYESPLVASSSQRMYVIL